MRVAVPFSPLPLTLTVSVSVRPRSRLAAFALTRESRTATAPARLALTLPRATALRPFDSFAVTVPAALVVSLTVSPARSAAAVVALSATTVSRGRGPAALSTALLVSSGCGTSGLAGGSTGDDQRTAGGSAGPQSGTCRSP